MHRIPALPCLWLQSSQRSCCPPPSPVQISPPRPPRAQSSRFIIAVLSSSTEVALSLYIKLRKVTSGKKGVNRLKALLSNTFKTFHCLCPHCRHCNKFYKWESYLERLLSDTLSGQLLVFMVALQCSKVWKIWLSVAVKVYNNTSRVRWHGLSTKYAGNYHMLWNYSSELCIFYLVQVECVFAISVRRFPKKQQIHNNKRAVWRHAVQYDDFAQNTSLQTNVLRQPGNFV